MSDYDKIYQDLKCLCNLLDNEVNTYHYPEIHNDVRVKHTFELDYLDDNGVIAYENGGVFGKLCVNIKLLRKVVLPDDWFITDSDSNHEPRHWCADIVKSPVPEWLEYDWFNDLEVKEMDAFFPSNFNIHISSCEDTFIRLSNVKSKYLDMVSEITKDNKTAKEFINTVIKNYFKY